MAQTSKGKVTIRVNPITLKQSKILAAAKGTSLSKMVEAYLSKQVGKYIKVKNSTGGKTSCSISVDFTETLKARRKKLPVHTE